MLSTSLHSADIITSSTTISYWGEESIAADTQGEKYTAICNWPPSAQNSHPATRTNSLSSQKMLIPLAQMFLDRFLRSVSINGGCSYFSSWGPQLGALPIFSTLWLQDIDFPSANLCMLELANHVEHNLCLSFEMDLSILQSKTLTNKERLHIASPGWVTSHGINQSINLPRDNLYLGRKWCLSFFAYDKHPNKSNWEKVDTCRLTV